MDRSERLNLAIGLPLRHQDALELLLQQLYDPSGPNYHQYLNPEEFSQRFGPSEHDYEALIQFAEANGLVVTGTHPNRTILDVSGPVAEIERALHLNVMSYWRPDRGAFYAPDRDPSLDLDVRVLDIGGLDNFQLPRPMGLKSLPLSRATPYLTGSGPAGLFIGGDFRAAYAPRVALTGTGQVVGLFELDGFYANDETANFAQAGLPPVPTQTVLLDGFTGSPGQGNTEVILDIMMASYMAPGLSKVIVYEGYAPNDVLNRMATDNLAKQLSSSWGFSPINATTEQIFKQYIAQGQSLLQASGDSGAYEGGVMPPADDPNVTVVGGTSLTTSGAGGAWQSESAWSGSGGGISTTYSIPSYQQGTNMSANGGSTTMRNIPDVALTADIQIFLIQSNGQAIEVGGTSCAAPLWAGFVALANQQAVSGGKAPAGFLNPQLYAIGNGSGYGVDFHDITQGSNGGFSTVPGYDLVTGWGTPAGQSLINDLSTAPATPGFTLAASPATLSISAGSSGVSTIAIGSENGFSGSVSLAAAGLPKGVTASFSPASTTGASTLTLAAGSSAAAGTTTITITGTSGALKSTATINLTITVPSFTLSASPASLTLTPGSGASTALTVNPLNGFAGSVSLVTTGLPKGVTASFSPVNTTGASTLALVAASSATAGTATITVTGTSGTLKSTASISLAIVVPTFTLAASPAMLTLLPSSSGSSSLTVNALNGFVSNVSLTVSGLPKGVTATFSPASTLSASTLTFVAASSVTAGTTTVTVTGTSGALKSTASISLTIVVPTFTLTASPNVLTIMPGSSGSSTLTVNPQNGFSNTVSLTVSGLPKGITASLSPASTAGTSTLTLVATASATAGTATVTVTGVSGTVNSTAPISLTIIIPNFSLSATSVGLTAGSTAASTATITPVNGFTGSVSLTASGLPKGVTASFSPSSTTGTSTLTFTAASTVVVGTTTVTITGTSGTLVHTTTISLVIAVPNFGLSASPATIGIPQGGSGAVNLTVVPLYGFSNNVSLAASGLPKGLTASFSPASTAGTSTLTLAASAPATAGAATVTVTGTSGTLSHTVTIVVTVQAQSASAVPVNLASAFNIYGIVTDGSTFTNGGLDGGANGIGEAYSANLLGSQTTINGVPFSFGPPNVANTVSGRTVPLPAGQFSTLRLLATAVNGSQLAQSFTVTYTDGSTSSFTQYLSDWFAPENFPGESNAITMAYRDTSMGVKDNRTFLLYGYSFTLNKSKQVSSIMLPGNRNVVVLAMTLVP